MPCYVGGDVSQELWYHPKTAFLIDKSLIGLHARASGNLVKYVRHMHKRLGVEGGQRVEGGRRVEGGQRVDEGRPTS